MFRDPNLASAFSVTIARTLVGVVLVTCNCAMAGFALRKKRLSFRKIYLAILLIPVFFQGGLIPTYLNYRRLGLLDTFLVFIIPQLFAFFYLVIFISGFDDIPDSLEEVGQDGRRRLLQDLRPHLPAAGAAHPGHHLPVRGGRAVELLVRFRCTSPTRQG